ncbi:hypothetical protein B0T18DRAFT_395175 [Schizothecium vesticola]|uniref:Uncharacterized protein n=1 Tax=Schizothecium vesticola TaxID=314040 RepID=A0AA40BRB4_9PEZI|nr:hypothetical protein B0T18DRAFT_395175 [Schizothecium vesticola]
MLPTTALLNLLQLAATAFAIPQRKWNRSVETPYLAPIRVLNDTEHVDLGPQGFAVETINPHNWWSVTEYSKIYPPSTGKGLSDAHPGHKITEAWAAATAPARLTSAVQGGPLYVSCGTAMLVAGNTKVMAEIYSDPDHTVSWPCVGTARDLLLSLLNTCFSTHEACCYQEGSLPTHALDVGSATQDPYLHIPRSGETGRYVTLSYYWGGSSPITTTTATLAAHAERYRRPSTTPAADWEREAPQMGAVYEGGDVMLTAEASVNSYGGCFPRHGAAGAVHKVLVKGPGEQDLFVHARLTNALADDEGEVCHRQNACWRRALRSGATEVGWECAGGRARECQDVPTQTDTAARFRAQLMNVRSPLQQGGQGLSGGEAASSPLQREEEEEQAGANRRWVWSNIVQEFTHRSLTVSSDLLPALSGLAERMSRTAGEGYLCELWRDKLVELLNWKPDYAHINTKKMAQGLGSGDFLRNGSMWMNPYPLNEGEKLWDERNGQSAFKVIDVEVERRTTNPFGPSEKKEFPAQGSAYGGHLMSVRDAAATADFEPEVSHRPPEASLGDKVWLLQLEMTKTSEEGIRKLPNDKLKGLSRIASGRGLLLKLAKLPPQRKSTIPRF